jgi:flagellar hook-associated protein 3 FlgL
MGVNRITNNYLTQQSLTFLNNNLSNTSALQQKLSSGQNINKPSDDPVGLVRVLDLSNTLRTDQRYSKNIQDSISEANTTDSVMSSMVDLIQRAQEITTQAANFTTGTDGRKSIGLEVDQIIDQMVQLGNTDIGGKYIFGGMKTDSPPFMRSGDNITYSGTASNLDWQRNVEIAKGVQISVNTNGNDLLGNSTVTTAGPPLPSTFSAGSQGIFKTLVELKTDLNASSDPNQLTEIQARLDELTTNMNTVVGKQAIVGAVSNRLDLSQGRIDDRKSVLTQQYASLQNVDTASTIADLNSEQNTMEASLNVTARVLQNSLLSYLK